MRGVLNCQFGLFPSDHLYNFPFILPFDSDIDFNSIKWVSFDKIKNYDDLSNIGIHFFIDDFKFECLWNNPSKYINLFNKCKCVIMPDFSLYYDYPVALQIYNKYRNHWLYNFYLSYGVNIIPNLNYSLPGNWDWSLIGYPKKSILAHSAIGLSKTISNDVKNLYSVIDILNPKKILFFNRSKIDFNSDIVLDIKLPFFVR